VATRLLTIVTSPVIEPGTCFCFFASVRAISLPTSGSFLSPRHPLLSPFQNDPAALFLRGSASSLPCAISMRETRAACSSSKCLHGDAAIYVVRESDRCPVFLTRGFSAVSCPLVFVPVYISCTFWRFRPFRERIILTLSGDPISNVLNFPTPFGWRNPLLLDVT